MIGKVIGDYEVIDQIGEGGMGRVFLARNKFLPSMIVVLKILKDAQQKERFLAEAATLSKLNHLNICQLKHFFHFEGDLIIALEYIEGKSLAALVEEWKTVDLDRVKAIVLQILDGLAHAHRMGIWHRDIKPTNIMIDIHGAAKVIDFGIARSMQDARYTATGMAVGTPQYMAPEQFTTENVLDYSLCDVYSLGICLYRLCCGRLPFEETNPFILKDKHCHELPPRPSTLNRSIAYDLEQVILRAIAKRPPDRFASAAEMRSALAAASTVDPTAKSADQSTETMRTPKATRKKITAVMGIALGLVLIVLAVRYGLRTLPARSPEKSASSTLVAQTINEGQVFAAFDLPETLTNHGGVQVLKWVAGTHRHLLVEISPTGRVLVAAPSPDWFGGDTIWFVATLPDGARDSVRGVFRVNAVNAPSLVTGSIDQRIQQGEAFAPINLNDYVTDADHTDDQVRWTYTEVSGLAISIDSNRTLIIRPVDGWTGTAQVSLVASDRQGARDTLAAVFSVVSSSETYELKLVGLPPQSQIYDEQTKRFSSEVHTRVQPGTYSFTLYSRDYPIRPVRIEVKNAPVDTTVDLQQVFRDAARGSLAVSAENSAGDLLSREILINQFPTRHACMDSLRTLAAGEYEVGIAVESSLRVDSVKVNDMKRPTKARVRIDAGQRTYVDFFVTRR